MTVTAHLEIEIRNLLLSRYSPKEILSQLTPRLYDLATSPADKRTIFAFAINSGLFEQLAYHIPELFRMRQNISWPHTIELFAKTRAVPRQEIVESILKGAKRQNQIHDLVLSRSWDKFLPEVIALRRDLQKERETQHAKQRLMLMEKLSFYRIERMADEEKRLIELLLKMYPDDEEIRQIHAEFQERWARHIITKFSHHDLSSSFSLTETMLSDEETSQLEPVVQEVKMIVRQRPDWAYEFAIVLMMMDLNIAAAEVLNMGPQDFASDWLKAELLLKNARFIECLDHITQLEMKHTQDPETAFATHYLRAQALFGLNQPTRAIELLQTLLSVRPHYRSAASLLKQWSSGQSL